MLAVPAEAVGRVSPVSWVARAGPGNIPGAAEPTQTQPCRPCGQLGVGVRKPVAASEQAVTVPCPTR